MAFETILLSQFTDPRFRRAFQTYFAELNVPVSDWDGLFREMDEKGPNLAYLLAGDGEEAAGFLQFQITTFSSWFFQEPFGFLREFWIAPAYRGLGYGTALLKLAEAYCLKQGARRILLTTGDAAAFYLARGYQRSPGITARNRMEVLTKSLN